MEWRSRHTMRTSLAIALLTATALPSLGQATHPVSERCAALARLSVPHATIETAQWVPAGAGASANLAGGALPGLKLLKADYQKLPAFCRVAIKDQPSSQSDIKVEIWLPAAQWNGKYRAQGNGGFAGYVDYRALAAAVGQGYATASTDTGHSGGPDPTLQSGFALHHPEAVIDFGWRAIHEMTLEAKQVIRAFYGRPQQYSYFASCSNGGRQALMEAQRFPTDYNGILAGDPANNWTTLVSSGVWVVQQLQATPTSYIPAAKIPAIASAVLAACDAKDGVRDGILNDPRQCHFDPESMLCKNGDSDLCLLPGQVKTLKQLYAGVHDASGRQAFPGLLPGAETGVGGWVPWVVGESPDKSAGVAFGVGFFRNFVYENPDWSPAGYHFDQALKLANRKLAQTLNANDANLEPFAAAGGKLILYQGWNDPAVPALSTLDYYNSVLRALGRNQTDAFARLYMVSGMQHCDGGPGPTNFGQSPYMPAAAASHDVFTALEQWVEQDKAPGTLIASKFLAGNKAPVMTRPICPYPEAVEYRGKGSISDAQNFTCSSAR